MNSGLQCLFNTPPLIEYFLSKKYLEEINENNVLGTKGNLTKKFGLLMNQVWYGNN
jgi:ubiquitin carboxyl-terminal hydrolase 4/11/15